jgi:hypothetical protein
VVGLRLLFYRSGVYRTGRCLMTAMKAERRRSMVVCRLEEVTDIATSDHHFQQEGFTILLTQKD